MIAFTHRNLPRLLLQARESVMERTRPRLREHGLSDPQWRVLRVLGEHGAVETGIVAKEAFILGPSLTGVLDRMERDGFVQRSRDAGDQRRSVVEATALGRRLVRRLTPHIQAHYDWMEAALGKRKLTQLYALLDELIALESTLEVDAVAPAPRRSRDRAGAAKIASRLASSSAQASP